MDWLKLIGFSLLFVLAVMIYFIPIFVASVREQKNFVAICILNIFLGWTFFGWVGALIWAVIEPREPIVVKEKTSTTVELLRYKELKDKGEITEKEYNRIIKFLLIAFSQ